MVAEASDESSLLFKELRLELVAAHTSAARTPRYSICPERLNERLQSFVKAKYPKGLYYHQFLAIENILDGHHTAITTGTASGKSLGFSLPIISDLLYHPRRTALLLYPLKALGEDQYEKLIQMTQGFGDRIRIYKYDGSVNKEQRQEAIEHANILIATPDVLHTTLLRRHFEEDYKKFFQNLRYVVMDECHVYDGVFGCNMAYVVRRLRQVCEEYGQKPQFLAASATVAGAPEFLKLLTGLDFSFVTEEVNGCASGGRRIFFVRPIEGSINAAALRLARRLLQQSKRFIMFCDSRIETESLAADINASGARGSVSPYRSGYESEDRKKIERALKHGELQGVISTSALELGVDIPDLPVCILMGLPASKVSFLQRIGRVGRTQDKSGTVFVFQSDDAINSYFFQRTDQYLEKEPERPCIKLDNRPLMLAHYACAKAEQQNKAKLLSADIFPPKFLSFIGHSEDDFEQFQDIVADSEPHFKLNIRCIGDPSYDLRLNREDGGGIGTITHTQMMREAFPNAIYQHHGIRYEVTSVNVTKKYIVIRPLYHCFKVTKPVLYTQVKLRRLLPDKALRWVFGNRSIEATPCTFGVTDRLVGYSENSGTEKIPKQIEKQLYNHFNTSGFVLKFSGFESLKPEALHAFSNALHNLMPTMLNVAYQDVSVTVDTGSGEAVLYVFDAVHGGLGLVMPLLEQMGNAVQQVYNQIASCSCQKSNSRQTGCPCCVQSNAPTRVNHTVDRKAALIWLKELLPVIEVRPLRTEGMAKAQSAGKSSFYMGADCKVFTASFRLATIVSSSSGSGFGLMQGERLYTLRYDDDGKTATFIGSKLTLVEGDILKICNYCGQDGIDISIIKCPNCQEDI